MARRRRRKRFTAIGGELRETAASDCSGNGASGSSGTSRINFDTGGLDRLYVRGLENVHKKFLIQAAACNLALLLRSTYGSGKPRAAHDRAAEVILMILAVLKTVGDTFSTVLAFFNSLEPVFRLAEGECRILALVENQGVLDTDC